LCVARAVVLGVLGRRGVVTVPANAVHALARLDQRFL